MYINLYLILYSYAYFNTNLFTHVCYRNILNTMAEEEAAAAVLFSTTGPFQGHILPFQGKTFLFWGNTGSFQGHSYREKGCKVQNYYILLLKGELLNSTLL